MAWSTDSTQVAEDLATGHREVPKSQKPESLYGFHDLLERWRAFLYGVVASVTVSTLRFGGSTKTACHARSLLLSYGRRPRPALEISPKSQSGSSASRYFQPLRDSGPHPQNALSAFTPLRTWKIHKKNAQQARGSKARMGVFIPHKLIGQEKLMALWPESPRGRLRCTGKESAYSDNSPTTDGCPTAPCWSQCAG